MGQKKKPRSGQHDKRGATRSQRTVSEPNIPSIESVDDKVSVSKERKICAHLEKGIDLDKFSSKIRSAEPVKCQDCRGSAVDRRGRGKHGKKKEGGSADSKAIWVCLGCGYFSCGGIGLPTTPQSHAVRHARQSRHPLAVQFENPHLRWCFSCEALIPVEKSEENGERRDVLSGIVKMIKGRSSEGSVEVEEVWFGTGSVTSELKLEKDYTVSSSSDGRGVYVVRGLVNLGNTCFFNSIMQNLLAMDRLRDYFMKLDVSAGPLTVALKQLYNETSPEAGLRNAINPQSLLGCVCAKAPQFRGYQQHDSHELLRCLLDGLCSEELSSRKQANSSQEDGISPNQGLLYVDAVFGGQISSTVCCLECGHSSTVYEPFLDLSLPVPTKKPPSKRAQPISRPKKSKLPPKRSERIRSKVNRDITVSAPAVSNSQNIGNSSCQIQCSVPVAGKVVASSDESKSPESIAPSTADNDKGAISHNFSATGEIENKQFFEKVTEETGDSLDNLSWLDYLEPDIASNDCNIDVHGGATNDHIMTSQNNDDSVIQESGNKVAVQIQNEVLLHNELESSSQVCSHYMEKTVASPADLTFLDYIEPDISLDNHDRASQNSGTPVILNTGNEDAVQNNVFSRNDSECSSQVCSFYMESSQNVDTLGNSREDELPLQVQGSEVLLLPYKEETSTPDEMLRGEGEVSSSAIGYEQDSFDGFGGLFNEPEIDAALSMKPLSSDNKFQANEVAETGFMDGHSSESDPNEVDNTDSPVSIDSCLAYFTKPELLSNEHAWLCENCSKTLLEQRMISRKKEKIPMSKNGIIGGEDRIQSAPSGSGKECSSHTEVGNLSNGNIKSDGFGAVDESLVSHNESVDNNENCILETGQKAEINSVASQSDEMNNALPELSESSSSYKTCCQESFNGQASDSCSVHEPRSSGCNADKVQQRETRLFAGGRESEGSEDDKTDSESVKVKRDATKTILIDRAPPILTIHLKRFSQDSRGRLSKLNGHVDFRDAIDLSPYMDPRVVLYF
ncbi:ubiquitin carboxyl-terminal hydrolase 2 isoform X2 [Cornus florida]|uniref:ubiquitin carboxyl-terminal hydrolase 2 isoform X2 n=1 Tax=Cornus florida TaxID=4283 RepID=UPI00289C2E05|nr:ubiquitin carboxyl-terminal hydrolase 2 isoform X2 [Cornus florida]